MRSAVCLLVCCLLVIGCDEPFEALQDNYKSPFSIYDYLDASADTQWVRVTPSLLQND